MRETRLLTFLLAAVTFASLLMAGCGARVPGLPQASGGSVRVQSLGDDPIVLSGRFETAMYSDAGVAETTFLLTDMNLDDLMRGEVREGQFIHLELLWIPRAGSTPISADATNVSVRYVIIADGEVGVYGGAGFALPQGAVGSRTMRLSLRDASLKLLDATDGFVDLLTPARISGSFTAEYDPRQTQRTHFAASQMVTDRLGRSVFVQSNHLPVICRGFSIPE